MRRSVPPHELRGQRKTTGAELIKERRRGGGQEINISCLHITGRRTRTSLWCETGDTPQAWSAPPRPTLTPTVDTSERDHSDQHSQEE